MKQMTLSEALNAAHHQLMMADETVVVIGEDVRAGVFGVTSGLATTFGPSRIINTPISETAFMGMGIGAAMTGLKPIVEVMFCDFIGVCFDQILNQAAKMRYLSADRVAMPLVVRTTMGAGDGSGAMHSQSLHGLLMQIPGLVVACPSTPADAAGLLKAALAHLDPVILLEHKGLYGRQQDVDSSLPLVPIGKGRLVRAGADVTLVAVSVMVGVAEEAATLLAAKGIDAAIIDPRTINPLDWDMIMESLHKTGHLAVIDEGSAVGGFADSVLAKATETAFVSLKAAPIKLVPPNRPVPYARALEKAYLPSAETVVHGVCQMVKREDL